jgi:t-SNARE complex subunit (syntaxin)
MDTQYNQMMGDRFDKIVELAKCKMIERIEAGIGFTDEPNFVQILDVELNKSLKESDIKIVEKKRSELLTKADPSEESRINRLLNEYVNQFTETNEPITKNGIEITLEQALDEISPKILGLIRVAAEIRKNKSNSK